MAVAVLKGGIERPGRQSIRAKLPFKPSAKLSKLRADVRRLVRASNLFIYAGGVSWHVYECGEVCLHSTLSAPFSSGLS